MGDRQAWARLCSYWLEPKNWLLVTMVLIGWHADGVAGAGWGLLAALFTAVQTYLQQEHTQVIQQIYAWILGSLTTAASARAWGFQKTVTASDLRFQAAPRVRTR